MTTRKILVTGDRNWDDIPVVVEALSAYQPGTIVVHGACRGADVTCKAVAEQLGLTPHDYPADWVRYPRAAGPIRNQQMLDIEHRADEPIEACLAFHDHFDQSRGTADMVTRCRKAGIPVIMYKSRNTTG